MDHATIESKVYLAWTSFLRRKCKVYRDRSFCFPAVQDHFGCNKCCLYCLKVCEKPKCWSLKTLKHCLFKCTSMDVMQYILDHHYKPKNFWKELERK